MFAVVLICHVLTFGFIWIMRDAGGRSWLLALQLYALGMGACAGGFSTVNCILAAGSGDLEARGFFFLFTQFGSVASAGLLAVWGILTATAWRGASLKPMLTGGLLLYCAATAALLALSHIVGLNWW